jgi:hypothetical protein
MDIDFHKKLSPVEKPVLLTVYIEKRWRQRHFRLRTSGLAEALVEVRFGRYVCDSAFFNVENNN